MALQPNMQNQPSAYTGNADVAVQQNRVLRNTYVLLAITLIPTTIGAVVGTNFINFAFMRASPIISMLAILAIFYGWIYMIEKNRDSSLGLYLLLGFTFCLGLLLAPLLQRTFGFNNGGQLVMMAAAGTAGVFFVLAGLASNPKRDFSFLSKFIVVGFVVIMLAVLANIFLQMPGVTLALCGAFIIFSSAVIVWQINNIVRGGETNYISATLTLYVAVYNLFSSLLHLLGLGGDRD